MRFFIISCWFQSVKKKININNINLLIKKKIKQVDVRMDARDVVGWIIVYLQDNTRLPRPIHRRPKLILKLKLKPAS